LKNARYLACAASLHIVDLSDSAAPTRVDRYDTRGNAYGVEVAGSLVYVADHCGGLVILGMNSGDPPRVVGTQPAPGSVADSGAQMISLEFDRALKPATVLAEHFDVLASGGDGTFDDGNEEPIPLSGCGFDPATNTVNLTSGAALMPDTYRLTVRDGVQGADGWALDGEFPERGNSHDFPSGDSLPGGNFVCRFDVLDPAAVYWMIGTPNDGGGEFDTDPHDDPEVIYFSVGSPDPEFPSGLGTDIGPQRSEINIQFEGELLSGGSFVVGWTPGGTDEPEQFSVRVDEQPIGASESLTGHVPSRWGTSRFLIPPLQEGQHTITLQHLTGDGLGFDFLALEPRTPQVAPAVISMEPAPGSVAGSGAQMISLAFDRALESATVQAQHFDVLDSGGDGTFDDGNEDPIPLSGCEYDPATYGINLTLATALMSETYWLTVRDEVQGVDGLALDGEFPELGNTDDLPSGDGTPGGDFVATFAVADKVEIVVEASLYPDIQA